MSRDRQTEVRRRRILLAVIVVLAAAGCGGGDGDPVVAKGPATPSTVTWERLPDPPLPERERTVAVWTGDELLLVGGDRFSCPPNASCSAPEDPPLRDGAALDVDAGRWREIADAPVGFHAAHTAVVGGDVYLLAHTDYAGGVELLRYRVDVDEWTSLPPPSDEIGWYKLLAAGDRLIAYPSSEEQGVVGDLVMDPETGAWSPLPEDPKSPAFDRTMVWAEPHVYLLDKENVPQPGSEKPSIVRAARLDLAAGTWEDLPDSEVIGGWDRWLVDEQRLISPLLGGADGGEVNGWGRTYDNGGILDTEALTWSPLPDAPPAACEGCTSGAGAFDADSAVYFGIDGPVLDAANDRWITMRHPAADEPMETPTIATIGRDAVTYVGGELWIWRAP